MGNYFKVSTGRLSAYYIFALLLIASLNVTAYLILSHQIAEGEKDSTAVNLFGRQRMLSQKVLAESLLLVHGVSDADRSQSRNGIASTMKAMSQGHRFVLTFPLKGDGNSTKLIEEIKASVQVVDSSFRKLQSDVDLLLSIHAGSPKVEAASESIIQAIIADTTEFLEAMDRTVFQFDAFALNRVRHNQRTDLFIVLSVLGLLAMEALFIFRPLIRRIVRAHDELETANRQLQVEINERQAVEMALMQTKQTAWQQDKLAAIGRLSAGIVHEIGNPLAAMHGLVDAARDNLSGQDMESVEQALLLIKDHLRRLETITREVSDFSAPQVREPILINLNELVNQVINVLKYDVTLLDIEFATTLNHDLPAIPGIPDQLMQVLMNLIQNAADGIRRNEGAENRIFVTTASRDGFANITVRDQGAGMDEETVARAFEPFQTTKAPGEGMGIGLFLCHGIVRQHGGEISIVSSLGEGTTVSVSLPFPAGVSSGTSPRPENSTE